MGGQTFDTWLAYSKDMSVKQDVSGRYGVDFRSPAPSNADRRALRLLQTLSESDPRMVRVNGAQFDYMNDGASAQAVTANEHSITSWPLGTDIGRSASNAAQQGGFRESTSRSTISSHPSGSYDSEASASPDSIAAPSPSTSRSLSTPRPPSSSAMLPPQYPPSHRCSCYACGESGHRVVKTEEGDYEDMLYGDGNTNGRGRDYNYGPGTGKPSKCACAWHVGQDLPSSYYGPPGAYRGSGHVAFKVEEQVQEPWGGQSWNVQVYPSM